MYEKSLIIMKPDALQRRLFGRIMQRFEDAGLKVHAMRLETATVEKSREHYAEHADKPFYPTLEEYITSGPVVVMVIGGLGAIPKIRLMLGATKPSEAAPGTIRGDFAHQTMGSGPLRNLVHASANAEDAAREIALWFKDDEIVDYPIVDDAIHGIG